VLHVAGDPGALEPVDSVAIVGARRGTAYGLEVARSLGRGIAAAGLPVVSGMATGVDSAAHVGVLDHSGRAATAGGGPVARFAGAGAAPPIAVLAGGAEVPYPPSRRGLYKRIVECGCVVSELPPRFSAHRWSFVARNRIIAALAALTVVVEAAERSGSLTTADFAEQLGRPVGAVPGPVTSRFSVGTNGLLAAGAGVIRGPRDVLDQLLGPSAGEQRTTAPPPAIPVEPRLRTLLDAIERGHGSLAELATEPRQTHRVLEDLTDLELRGLVRREFGGRYVRALGDRPW
jgi:DNA processing protein